MGKRIFMTPGDMRDPSRVANIVNQYASALFGTRTAKTAAYTVADTDIYSVLALGGTAFYTLTFNAASNYDPNFVAVVLNEDSGRGKRISPSGATSFILWPGQSCIIFNDNGSWIVLPAAQRWVIAADTTFYIDAVNGSDTNDGLASGAGALASFSAFNSIVAKNLDTNLRLVFAQLAAGTYSQISFTAPVLGGGTICLNGVSNASVTVNNGASATLSAVTCTTPTTQGVFSNSSFLVENVTLTASGGGHCLAINSGNAIIYTGVVFGSAGTGNHIQVDSNNSRLFCGANYSITAGAACHLVAVGGGLVDFNNAAVTATLTGTPAFTGAFAFGNILSPLVSLVTWSGAATGTRYSAIDNSVIYTNGAGATYFPGNAAGTTATGGQYV